MNKTLIASALAAVALAACQVLQTQQAPSRSAAPQSTPAPVAAAAPIPAPAPAPAAAPAPPPPPTPPLPFNDALQIAANNLFSNARLAGGTRQPVLIDPLVDGITGMESAATRDMEKRLVALAKASYPALDILPFTAPNVRRAPWVLVGTFTPINAGGAADGARDAYRICLALADLSTGKIVSKGFARAKPEGVDITPTRFYEDSPTWMNESLTEGYIKTCQGTRPGDAIHPIYLDGVLASAQIAEGIAEFQAGRYREAMAAHRAALGMPQGNQLRALNGMYLAQLKLRQTDAASETFGRIIDFGLANKRIAVKLLFKPGTSDFVSDPSLSSVYPMWLNRVARHAAQASDCLEVIGHTSKTGAEPANLKLSQQRAESVRARLARIAPALRKRMAASGVGSKETLVGLGTDDLRDALDRRVVFRVSDCART